jgi:hypothetical protein
VLNYPAFSTFRLGVRQQHEGELNMAFSRQALTAVVALAVCSASLNACQAGGLINNLPPDGSYVVFRAKSEVDLMGNLQTFDREIKLASVGKQMVGDEPARWIELSTEFVGRPVFAKLLIPERYLKSDQNPFEHIAKAIARGMDGEVVELPKERLRQIMTIVLPISYFDKLEKKDNAKIRTELGEYDCDVMKGETELDGPMGNKVKIAGDIWVNNKVPFGLIKAKVKGDLPFGKIETELEVIKSGTEAKSELPDAK